MKTRVIIFLLLFSHPVFSQSLMDSLFSGKIKVDTTKKIIIKNRIENERKLEIFKDSLLSQLNNNANSSRLLSDSVILISVDTSSLAMESAKKAWQNFFERWIPVPGPEEIKKYDIPKGLYKAFAEFFIEADGTVKLIGITCPAEINYLKPILEKYYTNAPKQIPFHRGLIYIKTFRKQPLIFTVK